MLTNTEIQEIIEAVQSGEYDIDDALKDIATAQRGEDVRKALYAEAWALNESGHAGAEDLRARQLITDIKRSLDIKTEEMSAEIATEFEAQKERIGNFIRTFNEEEQDEVLYSVSSLSDGAIAAGTEITLPKSIDEFDYLDFYFDAYGSQGTQSYIVDGFNGTITSKAFNVSNDPGESDPGPSFALYEMALSVSGNKVTVTSNVRVSWSGNAAQNASWSRITDYSTLRGTVLYKIVGRKKIQNEEVADIRIGYDGTEYETAGDAVRSQIGSLTLGIDEEDGLLYLYVNGVKHGDGVDVGGGGSGTRYTITYTLGVHAVSSDERTKILEGSSYTTVISSDNVDYQIEQISVSMGGNDITAEAVQLNNINIPSVTGDVAITVTTVYYPSVQPESYSYEVSSGGTGTLKVKLHAQPTQSQTVSIYSETLTLDESELTFTTSNWDTYQEVEITAPDVEATEYHYINLTNSDPMMTESTVMVTVKELGYEDLVDTTIPTAEQHTLTAADFTTTSDTTIDGQTYTRLYGYNGAYDNVIMPAEMNGKKTLTTVATSPSASNSTFATNTTIKYVTFENGCRFGEGGTPASNKAVNAFNGCTSLIGVSNMPTSIVSLQNAFYGCTNLKFIDNLDELVDVTAIGYAFQDCSSLEYIQDLSNLTLLDTVQAAFKSSGLKKIFGLPELNTTTANATNMYSGCASLQYGIVPKGVSNLAYAFYNCAACRRVDIFDDDLTTTAITNTTFSGCEDLDVYCNDDTTTKTSLLTQYGSSTKVTIKTFGGSTYPSIVVWGDSISSPNKPWIEWPKRLQTYIGTGEYLVKDEALAGETSPSTTARQGGYEMTVDAFTIPADTTPAEITITYNGDRLFSQSPLFSCGGSFNPCTINGVKGRISFDSYVNTKYYFTRLEAGSAVSVPADSVITSENDSVFNAADNVMIFYLNGNGGWDDDADILLDMFQKAVDHFEDMGGTKYIVSGPAANVILKNQSIKAEVLEFETKAAVAFGSHWLNLREYEIQYGLAQNNLTASALDTERMAQGLVPASLVGGGTPDDIAMYNGTTNTDENHPNAYGANTIMLAFYEKGVALGYWNAVE